MSDLWGGITIPVVGVSGDMYSGKTIFLSGIDPPGTLMIDNEKSSVTYDIPFAKRIDLYTVLQERYPDGYTPLEEFYVFREIIEQCEKGKYSVIACDDIARIEDGVADYVASQHKKYGFTSPEKFRHTGGIFWKAVLRFWEDFLGQIAERCDTFAFSTHLKGVWKGGQDTGRKVPEGKKSLYKMSSLYLWLVRPKNSKDKPPEADVLKSRLAKTEWKDGELKTVPILPDHLPEATPNAIRRYVQNPAGAKRQLSEKEKYHEPQLSEEERLRLQHETAEAQRQAAEFEYRKRELMTEAAQNVAQTQSSVKGSTAKTDGQNTDVEKDLSAWEIIRIQGATLGMTDAHWQKALERRGVASIDDLSEEQAEELRRKLWDKITTRELESDYREAAKKRLAAARQET